MERKPIVLVGLMGAGKTSIGRALARKLDAHFIDLDQEIEKISGSSVIDIFAMYGESEFRRIEEKVFARILDSEPVFKIISTGEGAFMTKGVRDLALAKSITIWLKAGLDLLEKRTSFRPTRPQLLDCNSVEILEKLINERYPVYALADIMVETADEPKYKTLERVLEKLRTPPR